MRLINGKTLNEIETELSAPLEGEIQTRKDTGYSYLPVDEYRQRLNDVVGRLHYSVEFSSDSVVTVGTEVELLVTCTITLYDDDGQIVCSKSERGGKSVVFPCITDANGKPAIDSKGNKLYASRPQNFSNQYTGASSDAFKRTCLNGFGIGENIREINASNKGKKANVTGNAERSMETVRFKFSEPLSDRKNGKGNVIAKHCTVINPDGVEVKFIIWNKKIDELKQRSGSGNLNLYSNLEQHLKKQFQNGKTTVPVSVIGYYNDYNGEKQFILNDIPK